MKLRKAEFNDWPLLLAWRNDEETRKNSLNTEPVSETAHKQWLEKILQDGHRRLFIALEQDEPAGTVRADYDPEHNRFELSWTVAPHARGKGLGKKMVKLLADSIQGKVMARVKTGNISSVKIAESAGLVFEKEENGFLFFLRK